MPLPCVCVWRRKGWAQARGTGWGQQPGLPHPLSFCACNSGHHLWPESDAVSPTMCPLSHPSWSSLPLLWAPTACFLGLYHSIYPIILWWGILCLCLSFLLKLSSSFPVRAISHSSLCSPPKIVALKVGAPDLENKLMVTGGEWRRGGIDLEFGIDMYTRLYVK